MCAPFKEGGLGVRSLIDMNLAFTLKTNWDLLPSFSDGCKFIQGRHLRSNGELRYVPSSIAAVLHRHWPMVNQNSR